MIKWTKLLTILSLPFLIMCDDDDGSGGGDWAGISDGAPCDGVSSTYGDFVVEAGQCVCPDTGYWLLGTPPVEQRYNNGADGLCFAKDEHLYYVESDCEVCSDLFRGGDFFFRGVPDAETGRKYENMVTSDIDSIKRSSYGLTPVDSVFNSNGPYYIENEDGDEFGFNFVFSVQDVGCPAIDSHNYARVRGQFSADRKTGEAMMVWYTYRGDDNMVLPFDTCYWELRNE